MIIAKNHDRSRVAATLPPAFRSSSMPVNRVSRAIKGGVTGRRNAQCREEVWSGSPQSIPAFLKAFSLRGPLPSLP